jgi:hypothetical protein
VRRRTIANGDLAGVLAESAARGVLSSGLHPAVARSSSAGHLSLDLISVAGELDPYFSLPALHGAPASARPRVMPETERSIDADDLPIEALQTPDERLIARTLQASGAYRANGDALLSGGASHGPLLGTTDTAGTSGPNGASGTSGGIGRVGGRHFSLKALTDRLGSLSR